MEEQKVDLFKHSPIYDSRFEIMEKLRNIGLKSGDILYRASDARGPLNLPFSRLVAKITKSHYSHAAILFIQNDEYNVLEINDQGTLKYRLIDWMDHCYDGHFCIYRYKHLDEQKEQLLLKEIKSFLELDPSYDFTFNEAENYYCTESVVEIYSNAIGVQIDKGYYIHEFVNPLMYVILRIGSLLLSPFGTTLPFDEKLYFVGNEKLGMISSTEMYEVFRI